MTSENLYWCLTEANEAFEKGQPSLAWRYVQKALEEVWCAYCHERLGGDKPYQRHFKGYVHVECRERYRGRPDYLKQQEG